MSRCHKLRKGHVIETATLGRTRVVFSFDGREAALDIASAGSAANPLTSDVLATFRCPGTTAMFNLPHSGPPVGLPRESIPAISNPMQKRISMSSVAAPLTNQR
ncbi:hypothetical protein I7819_07860 [Burkholderia multivorans]|nr:hypothetical protein [Burkholderia multivorans]MBJ9939802.1 hypothetical protein [Burkholderia multivorans]